jgi:ParB-like chromosome segregation protein Spo0J
MITNTTLKGTENRMAKVWKVHPVAKLFPRMPKPDFDELKADIAAHGIRIPILVNKKKDTILDGRNRVMAAHDLKLADKDVPVEVFDGSEDEAVSEIVSRNIMRRNLTDEQRVSLLAKLLGKPLEAEARKRQLVVLKSTQQGRTGKAELPLKSTQQGRTHDIIAKAAKVSVHKARAALETAKHAPKELDKVIEAKQKLAAAHKKVKAKARKVAKPKAVKTLRERVETKFVRFMEAFAVVEFAEVRKILREILAKTETTYG